jgi:hypothetical protein
VPSQGQAMAFLVRRHFGIKLEPLTMYGLHRGYDEVGDLNAISIK